MKKIFACFMIFLALLLAAPVYPVMAATPASVSTLACTGFSSSTAILNGQLTSLNGGGAITIYGFNYGLTTGYGSTVIAGTSLAVGSKYWYNLTGLSPATTYHYRAAVYNGSDWGYGSDMTFSTSGSSAGTTTTTTATSDTGTSGGGATGGGTTGLLAKWLGASSLGNASVSDVAVLSAVNNMQTNTATTGYYLKSTGTNASGNGAVSENMTHTTISDNLSVIGTIDAGNNINFNTYKAIAMSCDNGATLPTGPVIGQWFLHTPTGRSVLMQYSGSAWSPIISIGAMTMYVDKTNGTDSPSKGTGTTTNAFRTVSYAISQIPPLYAGNVTINVTAEDYSGDATINIRGKYPTDAYSISIVGALATVGSSTSTGRSAGSNATMGTITDTGGGSLFGSDQSRKLLKVTDNSVDYYFFIQSVNTGTKTATVRGYFQAIGNVTYTVYDWTASTTKLPTVNNYIPNINFYNCIFSAFNATSPSNTAFYRCKFIGTPGCSVQTSSASFFSCYFIDTAGSQCLNASYYARVVIGGCYFYLQHASTIGIYCLGKSYITIYNNSFNPTIITGSSTTSGLQAMNGSGNTFYDLSNTYMYVDYISNATFSLGGASAAVNSANVQRGASAAADYKGTNSFVE